MKRISVLIDGFNLYHSIDCDRRLHKYKWLNLYKLASILIPKSASLSGVYYFTALAEWDQHKVAKHKTYIRIQEHYGVNVVYGKFKMRDKKCHICNRFYKAPEEKQTDVNIAIKLLTLAFNDEYDTAIIISGDSDLIPSVKAVKNSFPLKKIGVAIPINRMANELQNISDFHMKIKQKQLESSMLPNELDISGKKYIRPSTWV